MARELGLHPSIVDQLCDRGWLRTYVDRCSQLTDAPKAFHLGVGLSILATTVGNTVYAHSWGQRVYPNLWIILLAPSGFYRKTTAMKMGLELLRNAVPGARWPDDWSREKLLAAMALEPAGLLVVYEFASLLARMQRDYLSGTKEMLTALWDSPTRYRRSTMKDGLVIDNAAPNILGASTFNWLQERLSVGDLRGGFLARFLLWPGTIKGEWRGYTPYTTDDGFMLGELSSYLKDLRLLSGEMDFMLVKDRLDVYIHTHEDLVMSQEPSPEAMGFFSRTAVHLLKLSILFQLSLNPTSLIVEGEALTKAGILIEELNTELGELIDEELVTSRTGRQLLRIKEIITSRNGGIDRKALLRKSKMTARQLDNYLGTLIESGEVLRVKHKSTGGRPLTTYEVNEDI